LIESDKLNTQIWLAEAVDEVGACPRNVAASSITKAFMAEKMYRKVRQGYEYLLITHLHH
jgi:hypothetical protein